MNLFPITSPQHLKKSANLLMPVKSGVLIDSAYISGLLGVYVVVEKEDSYTATSSDFVIICNKATAMTINLPAASGSGKVYHIKNVNIGQVTVNGHDTDTIDGELTQTTEQWENITIIDYKTGVWAIL